MTNRPGEILRKSMHGTTATYRVLHEDGDGVLVEVIDAPGLPQGFQLRLTAGASRALERVTEPEHERAHMLRRLGPATGTVPNG